MTDTPHEVAELRLPANNRYLRVARLTASGFASKANFDLEQLDDLRLAVGEACALLIDLAPASGELIIRYEVTPSAVIISGACTTENGASIELDDAARAVFGATVDSYAVEQGKGENTFVLQKLYDASTQ